MKFIFKRVVRRYALCGDSSMFVYSPPNVPTEHPAKRPNGVERVQAR